VVVAGAGGGTELVDDSLAVAEEVASADEEVAGLAAVVSADEEVAGLAELEVSVLPPSVRLAMTVRVRMSAPAMAHQRLYQAF
jgi:hypothetical protein